MKTTGYLLLTMFLALAGTAGIAQTCEECTHTINEADTATYVLGPGQSLCIGASGMVLGKITLNGGAICNSGVFNADSLIYTEGAFDNYGSFNYKGNLVLRGQSQFTNRKGGSTGQANMVAEGQAVFRDENLITE